MNDPFNRQLEIFGAALKMPAGEARERYLRETCSGDPELFRQVSALIKSHQEAGTFLEDPAAGVRTLIESAQAADAPGVRLTEGPGDRIGRYKLLQQIGEGGMGVVYMAEQEEPVRRRVALKVIKLGMDTRQVVARFEAERQALAMMDHPNIAKVLDAGATDSGRPYFVMELVRGVPITEYCDRNHLSARQRLELFLPVCHAIQHAHQKGVIHRDIKPSNVLVTLHDGRPIPMVIDFGVAKATNQKLTEKTLFTNFAAMIGTPAYMSPEKAEMSKLDVDTRSDIYSLGVLLYELLTGTTPFPDQRLRSLGYGEMQRIIVEEEPQRPSTRLSTMEAAERTAVAKNRGVESSSLRSLFRGDLDWVVMKCLEKDRTRRYETATGLAADLQRHLNNEVVVARPPTAAYRFKKTIRRNYLAWSAAGATAFALMLGTVVSFWQAVLADRARSLAVQAEAATHHAQLNEKEQKQAAQEQLYDSLIAQAQALRKSRLVGYRSETFAILKRAAALDVSNRNMADLRREASLCLGDFVGPPPVAWTDFPKDTYIVRVVISPSGENAAFSLSSGVILIREIPSGRIAATIDCETAARSLAFNSRGDELSAVCGPMAPWLGTNSIAWQWKRDVDGPWRVNKKVEFRSAFECFTRKDHVLVCFPGRMDSSIIVADLATLDPILEFPRPRLSSDRWPEMALSPKGDLMIVETSRGEEMRTVAFDVWDFAKREKLRTLAPALPGRIAGPIEFNRDGSAFVLLTEGGAVVFESEGFQRRGEFFESFLTRSQAETINGPSSRAGFQPFGDLLALPFGIQARIRLWDWRDNSTDTESLDEPAAVAGCVFTPDGKMLLSVGLRHARLYRADLSSERVVVEPHAAGTTRVAFSPTGLEVASVGGDNRLIICNARTGRKARTIELAERGEALSSDLLT